MILQLIDEYKNRPILWDRDHKHFRNGDRKMKAWADMAAVFNLRETWEVKKKMNSLLASYRRERHKIRAKTTKPGENIVSTWFGFKALDSFLHEKYLDASQRYATQVSSVSEILQCSSGILAVVAGVQNNLEVKQLLSLLPPQLEVDV